MCGSIVGLGQTPASTERVRGRGDVGEPKLQLAQNSTHKCSFIFNNTHNRPGFTAEAQIFKKTTTREWMCKNTNFREKTVF